MQYVVGGKQQICFLFIRYQPSQVQGVLNLLSPLQSHLCLAARQTNQAERVMYAILISILGYSFLHRYVSTRANGMAKKRLLHFAVNPSALLFKHG